MSEEVSKSSKTPSPPKESKSPSIQSEKSKQASPPEVSIVPTARSDKSKEVSPPLNSYNKVINEIDEQLSTPPKSQREAQILPPIESLPQVENKSDAVESFPPASPSEVIRLNRSVTNGNYKEDTDILPRRKSRMPFGERLSLVQYNKPEPAESIEDEEADPIEELKKMANCSLPPIEPEKQLRCIMDSILPPRKREIDGQSWLERASTVPCTRLDILGLQQRFETELNVCHAKSFGICPIRRRIYDELFDELIRQVTINCAERGLLLLRVRDEIHLSILSYQTLLESAIGYGVRKAVLFEQQQSQALIERDLEKVKNAELNRTVEELEKQLRQEAMIREEEIKLLEATMKDENERLLESNRTLKMDQQLQVQQATLSDVVTKES